MSIKTYTGNDGIRESSDNKTWVGSVIGRTFRQATITLTTTAAKIPTSVLSNRKVLLIVNISANIIYLGNSAVTTSDGFPLYQRQSMSFYVEDDIDVYGIAGSSSEIRIIEGA